MSISLLPIRLFLVDDQPIVETGLSALAETAPGLEIVGSATNGRAAAVFLADKPVDVVILDVAAASVSGLDFIREIKDVVPSARILCFSALEEQMFAERALRAGAVGYLMKSASNEHLVDAIRAVHAGQVSLSEHMSRTIIGRLAMHNPPPATAFDQLSNREVQVLHNLGELHDNRQIADAMRISVKTVEAHRSRIKEKLKLQTTGELIRFAMNWVESQGAMARV